MRVICSLMPLYEMTGQSLIEIPSTSYVAAAVKERGDLQRLLREHVEIISPDTLVIAEEFGEFEDSRRRIDLLGVDRGANLVVIELKRTDDGGHMELQSIRYAAMVSAMTWRRAVEIYAAFLTRLGRSGEDAEQNLLDFLDWEEPHESEFAKRVRIVLASADFGRELTTAVLWLNKHEVDITCVHLRPHNLDGRLILDIRQVIPLPEAAEYQVKLKEKAAEERADASDTKAVLRQFWHTLLPEASLRSQLHAGISTGSDSWIGTGAGVSGIIWNYVIRQQWAQVELYIDTDKDLGVGNKRIFDVFHDRREAIEEKFGGSLVWQRLDEKRACRIAWRSEIGGYRSPREQWPAIQDAMIDAMVRLEAALRPYLEALDE